MSLEMNKIAASVLTAGVVAMGASFVAGILMDTTPPDEPHYAVALPERDDAPDAPTGPEPILALLADADVAAGEQATRACAACHTFEQGGAHRAGPNLYGIVGDEIAGRDFNYSNALQDKDDVWTYENLNAFLHDPRGWAPGTTMGFAGVSGTQERANLIAYMRELDDDPEPLPSEEEIAEVMAAWEEETAEPEEEPAEAEDEAEAEEEAAANVHALIAAGDPEAGQGAARACLACHNFEEGGAHQMGPALYDIIGMDIAGFDDFNYSDGLAGTEGEWTYENLWAFLKAPDDFAPGNRMAFPGVRDDDDLADLIAYMRQQSDDPPPLEE